MSANTGIEETTGRERNHLSLPQRMQADFVNCRRRTELERQQPTRPAGSGLIVKPPPMVDELKCARQATSPAIADSEPAEGLKLIQRKLVALLQQEDVAAIQAVGKDFDSHQHQAVSYERSHKYCEGKATKVISNGYRLLRKIVPAAEVVVPGGSPHRSR
ncbi:MAG: nucleotide exchange factor GrpE [Chloroflexi bacterium]|nr:nucleotide exchange factor GrpE [Chloroflexota bacterium]